MNKEISTSSHQVSTNKYTLSNYEELTNLLRGLPPYATLADDYWLNTRKEKCLRSCDQRTHITFLHWRSSMHNQEWPSQPLCSVSYVDCIKWTWHCHNAAHTACSRKTTTVSIITPCDSTITSWRQYLALGLREKRRKKKPITSVLCTVGMFQLL